MAEQAFPAQQKLERAMTGTQGVTPETTHELNKHLIESLTSKDPGMIALGYDCLQEVIGMLDGSARELILASWNEYFDNEQEFKDIMEDKKASPRLLEIYKDKVKPLMMKPKQVEHPPEGDLQSYLRKPE